MKSTLGWTLLSRDALKRAESLLDTEQGVRDEIGFLLLHQAYSDRFFPGTSVLQTRVRYAIFIPLIFRDVTMTFRKGDVASSVVDAEKNLTRRLNQSKMGDGAGVIGGKIHPDPPVQSPSMIYWNALSTWGFLYPNLDGSTPTRSATHRAIARRGHGSILNDDDEAPLEEKRPIFIDVPEPINWRSPHEPLDFTLTPAEKSILKKYLKAVMRTDGEQSLLARMVEKGFSCIDEQPLWSEAVRDIADKEDSEALVRAGQASSISAIGRAVYDALVEVRRVDKDGLNASNVCRQYLEVVKAHHQESALKLDIELLHKDIPRLPQYFVDLLSATKKWLSGSQTLIGLMPFYESAESVRKGSRACLPQTLAAKERRVEWKPPAVAVKGVPEGEPLHYRWRVVTRLLRDIQGE